MGPFKTKRANRGLPADGPATLVVVGTFTPDGRKTGVEAIVSMFTGSDGGKTPAAELAAMLNEAWDRFHSGGPKDAQQTQDVEKWAWWPMVSEDHLVRRRGSHGSN